MSQIDDGGSAFPHGEIVEPIYDDAGNVTGHRIYSSQPGMRLRDWLAGQALQGLMVNYNEHPHTVEVCAQIAYDAANALAARLTKPE